MKILGLEFSTPRRSVGILHTDADGATLTEVSVVQEVERSTKAFAMIQSALEQVGLKREEIDCIAVGIGPGSLTGIRIAIAIAQGWHLACVVKVAGISSMEGLAHQMSFAGITGHIAIMVETRRNEFARAVFDVSQHEVAPREPLASFPLNELPASDPTTILAGPGLDRMFPAARSIYPDALTICRIASRGQDYQDGAQLQPILLRPIQFVKAPPSRSIESSTES